VDYAHDKAGRGHPDHMDVDEEDEELEDEESTE
jgi:hypothetical protein